MCGHRDSLTPFRICDGCFSFAVKAEIVTLLWLGSKWKVFSNALNQSRMYHRKHPKRKNEERRNIGCPIRNSLRWSPLESKAQHFSCISWRQQEFLCVLSSMRVDGMSSHLQDLEGRREEQPLHQICEPWENWDKQGLGSSAAATTHPDGGLWSKNMERFNNHKADFVTLMTWKHQGRGSWFLCVFQDLSADYRLQRGNISKEKPQGVGLQEWEGRHSPSELLSTRRFLLLRQAVNKNLWLWWWCLMLLCFLFAFTEHVSFSFQGTAGTVFSSSEVSFSQRSLWKARQDFSHRGFSARGFCAQDWDSCALFSGLFCLCTSHHLPGHHGFVPAVLGPQDCGRTHQFNCSLQPSKRAQ